MRMGPTDFADVTGHDVHLPDERLAAGSQLDGVFFVRASACDSVSSTSAR